MFCRIYTEYLRNQKYTNCLFLEVSLRMKIINTLPVFPMCMTLMETFFRSISFSLKKQIHREGETDRKVLGPLVQPPQVATVAKLS